MNKKKGSRISHFSICNLDDVEVKTTFYIEDKRGGLQAQWLVLRGQGV